MTGRTDLTGRNSNRRKRSRFKRPNAPPADIPWIWITQEMMESAAWLVLSKYSNALLAVLRVAQEHMAHGGAQNGELPVTFRDFGRAKIPQNGISSAIEVACALRFIRRTGRGRRTNGRNPGASSLWALTWLPTADGDNATNGWKSFKTEEDARLAATRALTERPITGEDLREDIKSAHELIPGRIAVSG